MIYPEHNSAFKGKRGYIVWIRKYWCVCVCFSVTVILEIVQNFLLRMAPRCFLLGSGRG